MNDFIHTTSTIHGRSFIPKMSGTFALSSCFLVFHLQLGKWEGNGPRTPNVWRLLEKSKDCPPVYVTVSRSLGAPELHALGCCVTQNINSMVACMILK